MDDPNYCELHDTTKGVDGKCEHCLDEAADREHQDRMDLKDGD